MNNDDNRADDILRFFGTNNKGNDATDLRPLAQMTFNLVTEFEKAGFDEETALMLTVEFMKAAIIANAPKNE